MRVPYHKKNLLPVILSNGRNNKKATQMLFHLAAIVVVTIWGGSFVWTKVLTEHGLSAVEIYIYRFLIAYVLIWPFSRKSFFAKTLKDEVLFALCGICGGSIYFLTENNAVIYTQPSNVSLLTTLAPLVTTILIGIIYKNERPGRWIWIGSAIAIVGVALIVFKNGFSFKVAPLGDMLALAAAFSWALYSLVLRKIDANYSALFITRKTFFYGLLTALPFFILEPDNTPIKELLQWDVLVNILTLAIGASLISYYLWSLTVKKLGAIKTSNYLYFQPVATMLISAYCLDDDPITLVGTAGCILIIGGVWLGDFMNRNKKIS